MAKIIEAVTFRCSCGPTTSGGEHRRHCGDAATAPKDSKETKEAKAAKECLSGGKGMFVGPITHFLEFLGAGAQDILIKYVFFLRCCCTFEGISGGGVAWTFLLGRAETKKIVFATLTAIKDCNELLKNFIDSLKRVTAFLEDFIDFLKDATASLKDFIDFNKNFIDYLQDFTDFLIEITGNIKTTTLESIPGHMPALCPELQLAEFNFYGF